MKIKRLSIIITTIVFIVLAMAISCNSSSTANCANNCQLAKPDSGNIAITLTKDSRNDSVHIFVYRELYNKVKDRNHTLPILKDTFIKSTSIQFNVPLDHDYSVKAVYLKGTDTINVIDGGKFANQEFNCDNLNCWQQTGGDYNVTLKFK
jgi:hypothetical protein